MPQSQEEVENLIKRYLTAHEQLEPIKQKFLGLDAKYNQVTEAAKNTEIDIRHLSQIVDTYRDAAHFSERVQKIEESLKREMLPLENIMKNSPGIKVRYTYIKYDQTNGEMDEKVYTLMYVEDEGMEVERVS